MKTKLLDTLIMIIGIAFIIINLPLFFVHLRQEQKDAFTEFEKEVAVERVVYAFINSSIIEKLFFSVLSLLVYFFIIMAIKTYVTC